MDYYSLHEKNLVGCEVLSCRTSFLHKMPKNSIVAEIGVFCGDYAERIYNITSPQKLYLIDHWPQERAMIEVETRFSDAINEKKVNLIQNFSIPVINTFSDNFFDWVYLDTDHSYENTYNELCVLSSKIKLDGYIAGHDYCSGHVKEKTEFGVISAVNKFCLNYDWKFKYLILDSGGHFSYCLMKI